MAEHPHDALDRFWDAVVTGEAGEPSGLDVTFAATVRRLHAAQPRSGANPRFVADLWGELSRGDQPAERAVSPRRLHRGPVDARPIPRSLEDGAGTGDSRRWLPILLSAALLVLTLGVALGARLPGRVSGPDHGGAPAIQAPATPSPVATNGVVLEFTVPVVDLPTTDWARTVFDHLSIPPGTTAAGSSNCCSGPMIEYVLSGSYTVRVAAAIKVIRAGGTIEHIPANTEVTLGPGDGLISRSETAAQITVAGPKPAELLNWILVDHSRDPAKHEEHVLRSWIVRRDDTKNPITAIPRAPLEVQIRKVSVPSGDAIPAPATGLLLVMPIAPGSYVTHVSDGSTQVFGTDEQPVTTYLLTLTQPNAPDGTPTP
jgi:hypothetical protein